MANKLDISDETSGRIATEISYFQQELGQFPAAFVATEPGKSGKYVQTIVVHITNAF